MDTRYDSISLEVARLVTQRYSTSFSLGIRLFDEALRPPIYALYGLVRLGDEIVDSWHETDQAAELDRLEEEVKRAEKLGYSTNPIIHAYVQVARQYAFDYSLIEAFFASMRMDLTSKRFTREEFDRYVYGSAEVVGLMCLAVFVGGGSAHYTKLAPGARALGSAFQKVNFLRDFGSDRDGLGRIYAPDLGPNGFDNEVKRQMEQEIRRELELAQAALRELPITSRRGVMLATQYYGEVLSQIEAVTVEQLSRRRLRVNDRRKLYLFVKTYVKR